MIARLDGLSRRDGGGPTAWIRITPCPEPYPFFHLTALTHRGVRFCGLVACGVLKYFPAMTTTISVSPKGQVELPEDFCKRKKIKPGTVLRVTEVGDGVYVTPVPEPTENELKEVIAAAGSLARRQTSADEEMVQQVIADYRTEKRRERG